MKFNYVQITKLLEKIFKAGFKTEKEILNIQLDDLQRIQEISTIDIIIILELKKAIRNKKLIAFLSGYEEERKEVNKSE